jgi:hypothetical protein
LYGNRANQAAIDVEDSMFPSWAFPVPAVLLITGGLSTLLYMLVFTA